MATKKKATKAETKAEVKMEEIMEVKFDKSKKIDLKKEVTNQVRSMTHNVNYVLPTKPTIAMEKMLERYYSGEHTYIDIDTIYFSADAQRRRPNILTDKILKTMNKNFDPNKFSQPIDVVIFHHNKDTYKVCTDGQGRCAFALYNGIRKLRCNVLFETDCWGEVCKIALSTNDQKNYQTTLREQKFEMMLEQGNKVVTKCYEFLKSRYDRVYLPSESSKGKKSYQNNVFGNGHDWSNYLWLFQFYDNTCKIEDNSNINPNTAVIAYQFIEEKVNNGHWYSNWMKVFNAINKAIKRANETYSMNMKFDDLFNWNADKVDYAKWSMSLSDRKNFSMFIDNGNKYSGELLAIALLNFCDHNNLLSYEYTKKGHLRKKWLIFIINELNNEINKQLNKK